MVECSESPLNVYKTPFNQSLPCIQFAHCFLTPRQPLIPSPEIRRRHLPYPQRLLPSQRRRLQLQRHTLRRNAIHLCRQLQPRQPRPLPLPALPAIRSRQRQLLLRSQSPPPHRRRNFSLRALSLARSRRNAGSSYHLLFFRCAE